MNINSLHSMFHGIREYLVPVLANSKFLETGVLTPEEFVLAGDYLVFKCPTWSWASGDPQKQREYLPPEKQYLVTRNVPCRKRVGELEYTADASETQVESAEEDEGWVATHSRRLPDHLQTTDILHDIDTLNDIDEMLDRVVEKSVDKDRSDFLQSHLQPRNTTGVKATYENFQSESKTQMLDMDDVESIPDMDDMDDVHIEEEEDEAALPATKVNSLSTEENGRYDNDKILKTRTYDLTITYDKYYQTPRVWLFGYSEDRVPLSAGEIFEDISQDHAHKTVTMESHPHLGLSAASIHPCRHAEVMKRLMERLGGSYSLNSTAGGDIDDKEKEKQGKGFRVDQYLILFLKFMSAVLPTMEYDYTMSLE